MPSTGSSSTASDNGRNNYQVTGLLENDCQEMNNKHIELDDSMVAELVKANNTSLDEGIEDCTLTEKSVKVTNLDKSVEEATIQLSNLILEYLIQQCFELKELILFPEVLHDQNFSKLLTKLTDTYHEYYECNMTAEQKNEIRVSLASYTLKLLEIDERFNNSEDSGGSNTISDKIFSISEFLNDILDHFFNSFETGSHFAEFASALVNEESGILHSTPEQPKKQQYNSEEDFEITTFHKSTKKKSGSEMYWMSVSNSPTIPKRADTPNKPILNVDDIPLRPPEDLIAPKRALSPIQEEPRVNLFYQFLNENEFDLLHDSDFNQQFNQDESIVESSVDSDVIDNILTQSCNNISSYIPFDEPDNNVVLSSQVNFFRTNTKNVNAYVKSKTAVFDNRQSENKENEALDDSGDWMGYDNAKF
ncbi:hypothetical protein JTB14_012805 [Gonioctena quinquepunctata]|nr:hypothetical protein JTB14_012805 [Gonioctena quinquepunctata]